MFIALAPDMFLFCLNLLSCHVMKKLQLKWDRVYWPRNRTEVHQNLPK